MNKDSIFGFALIGLLHQQPMSGYDLRKVLTTTAMGSFSDSPGAIYPALHRLEARKLVQGTMENSTGMRRRQVYSVTSAGLESFKAWLQLPVGRDDVLRGGDELMLRFAFMDHTLGEGESLRFLLEYARELCGYIEELGQYLSAHGEQMPLSGRLALECGKQEYETRLRWAERAAALYEERKENRS